MIFNQLINSQKQMFSTFFLLSVFDFFHLELLMLESTSNLKSLIVPIFISSDS